jgi:hypothetical protein
MASISDLTDEQLENLARKREEHWRGIRLRLKNKRIRITDPIGGIRSDMSSQPTIEDIISEV